MANDFNRAIDILTQQDIKDQKKRQSLPRPRTITEVSSERIGEKMLEALAPRTGYPELDRIIKGYVPGHLYTLTGNENVGKTSLACNFAVRISRQGKKVLYFALEPENTVVEYIASVRTDKEFGNLTHDDIKYDDGNIHVYGKEQVSKVEDLVDIIEALPRYDLIIIDHIGYFVSDLRNTNQEQSNIIKRLAGLCKRKQCAIMMIAHLRKKAPNQKKNYVPSSDDISGSGAFKQDSTEVMIVVRKLKETDDQGSMEYSDRGTLYVTKTKCGPNGQIEIIFSDRKANIKTQEDEMFSAGINFYESQGVFEREALEIDDELNMFG